MSIITNKLNEFESTESILKLTDEINQLLPSKKDCQVYPNQVKCGIDVLKKFDGNFPRPNHIVIQGKTQAGKTGVLTSITMLIRNLKLDKAMSINRIIYITGDNGCKLLEQTQKRIRECFNSEDFMCEFICMKNSDMKKDIENRFTLTNAIIFIDESHYGVKNAKNILIQWLESKGLDMHNWEDLIDKHVYIISNSATPFGEIVSDNAQCKAIVRLATDNWDGKSGYIGFKELYDRNVIQGVTHNINKNNADETCELIRQKLIACYEDTGSKKCAIIRMTKKAFNGCKDVLEQYFQVETYFASSENINYYKIHYDIEHINDDESPINEWKPLCVVVAGAYRMGVSIPEESKKNIGVVYDYCKQKAKNGGAVTTEQGLLGRSTGYWNNNEWKRMTIFINEEHIKALNTCYIEEKSQTTMVEHKSTFEPCKDGDIVSIVPESEVITIKPVSPLNLSGQEYNIPIKNYLENWNKDYKDMIFFNGRRNSDKQKQQFSTPQFSNKLHGAEKHLKPENDGKRCYTILYDSESDTIYVRFGTIRIGRNIEVTQETKKVIKTLETY